MTPYYKFPILSRIAHFIGYHLPNRVRASLYSDLLEQLIEDECKPVEIHEDDAVLSTDVVSAVRLIIIQREMLHRHLYATVEEKNE